MDEHKATKLVDMVLFPSIFIGEGMQVASITGAMDYTFLTGHLSDFALAGYFTTLGLQLTEGKVARFMGVTLPATLLTLGEYFPILPLEDNIDHLDTVCYWAAAGAVTGVVKYLSDDYFRDKINSAIKKLDPFSRTSNLDELINQPDTNTV